MKQWKNYLLSMLAVAGFVACSDDDPGLAPVIDGQDLSVELKRDTADVYKISLPITSEEGLAKVLLIDNATNNAIDEQISFSNPNSYIYNYDFDLTPYKENTVVMLTLKIEDQAGQVVNKKITLTVKKFSELDVRFAAEGITSQFEDCNLKLTVIRGLIPLKEVKVYVGATLSDTYDLSLSPEESRYDLNVLVNGLAMGNNTVKVVVVDNKEQEFEKEIAVNRIEGLTWRNVKKVQWDYNSFTMDINDAYPNGDPDSYPMEDGKLHRLCFSIYDEEYMPNAATLDIEYDEQERVSSLIHKTWKIDYETYNLAVFSTITYKYEYEGSEGSELSKVTCAEELSAATNYLTDFVYESGSIKSYKINGTVYTPQYIEKGGEMIRVDKLGNLEQTYELGDEKHVNPIFLSQLPGVVPCTIFGIDMSQFLYNKYFFTAVKEGTSTVISYNISGVEDLEYYLQQSIVWTDQNGENTMKYRYSK